jgi:hypothetical protein
VTRDCETISNKLHITISPIELKNWKWRMLKIKIIEKSWENSKISVIFTCSKCDKVLSPENAFLVPELNKKIKNERFQDAALFTFCCEDCLESKKTVTIQG